MLLRAAIPGGGLPRCLLVAGLLAAALSAAPLSTSAAGYQRVGNSMVLMLSADHSNVVLVPAAGVEKQSYDPAADAAALGAIVSPTSSSAKLATAGSEVVPRSVTGGCGGNCVSGRGSITACPPGGSCAALVAQFYSNWLTSNPSFWSVCQTVNGTSSAYWAGTNPYNATSIDLSDHWSEGGVAVSVSFPGGVGITGGGSDAYWGPRSVANNWQIYHTFNGIKFCSNFELGPPSETASTTAQFSYAFYSTTAYS
jgi:hypothetical protein